jgi:hypothetical protein
VTAIEYHADLKEVQPALPGGTTPFDRVEWWQGLAEHCGMTPLLAVARNGAGSVALPLTRRDGRLEALANWYSFTVRPVASPGIDRHRLLTDLARDLTRKTHRLTLAPIPDEDGDATALAEAFRATGWIVRRDACDTNHVLPVAGRSYAEYLAGRPGQLRTTLKRKASKVTVTIHRVFDSAAWDAYEEIYRHSWKPEEGSPAFLRAFAEREGAAGRLRFGLARAEGRPVAAQFWTVESGIAYIHKLAHLEDAKPLSPGTTLSAALFQEVIDRDRVELVDFGTGDDPYKRDWMELVRPRYRIDALRPADPRNWPTLARGFVTRLAGARAHG